MCGVAPRAEGTACDDGDATTVGDVCVGGVCAGVDHCVGVSCAALDACHVAGTCDHATGHCDDPSAADGAACDDGDACTQTDVCVAGFCAGGNLVACGGDSSCVAGACVAPPCGGKVGLTGLSLPMSHYAASVAIADLNGDGNPDLVASNSGDAVSVLLSSGGGTFAASVDYPTGTQPYVVAAADVNGDGKPDLAVANQISDTVSVLLNQGDGTFAASVDYPTGAQTEAVAAADLNGDGMADLVVGLFTVGPGYHLLVLLSQADGTFAASVDYPGGGSSIAAADLDGDGKLDLAVLRGGDGMGVLLNHGDGSFAAAVHYPSPASSVTAADLNGDGKPDLATAHYPASGSGMGVLLNHGDGTFAAEVTYGGYSGAGHAIAAADLNNDGRVDLAVVGDTDYGALHVWLGAGDGTFPAMVDYPNPSAGAMSIAAADLNNDGRVDLAFVPGGSGVQVLFNTCLP